MENISIPRSRKFISLGLALLIVFSYFLGVGIARYLGNTIHLETLGIGLFWVLGITTFTFFIALYFEEIPREANRAEDQPDDARTGLTFSKEIKLMIAFIGLTISAIMMVLMIWAKVLVFSTGLIMVGIIVIVILYAVPPLQAWKSPYSEFLSSIVVANLIPMFAFNLISHEYHRLMAMITFPLTVLLIGVQLIASLPDYSLFLKRDDQNMLMHLGWRRSISIHNILILITYVLFGVGLLFGLPLSIGLPPVFTLPLSLFQIWYLSRLIDGAKTDFRILLFNAAAITGLVFYLLVFAVWTN